MALERYRQKRDFGITPEPRGRIAAQRASELAYVIQKHAASHLHYDFRLELGGVLLSWAVPKGPSLDPHERRLAMRIEDHPLEYGGFEGVIPPQQYGAGTVMLWDRGTWTPEEDPVAAYRRGRLKFELDGAKLKGGWLLIRTHSSKYNDGKQAWLLSSRTTSTPAAASTPASSTKNPTVSRPAAASRKSPMTVGTFGNPLDR
jgi:bifunctional non-homologous end joining protein LigD